MAIAVRAFVALELALMRTETPEQFGMAVRWIHVPVWGNGDAKTPVEGPQLLQLRYKISLLEY
jgi:hypothetical protein